MPQTPAHPTSTAPLWLTTMGSPVGELRIVVSDRGLRAVLWEDDDDRVALGDPEPQHIEPGDHPVARAAVGQLGEYFEGTRTTFDLPLDLVGSEFQILAWLALGRIPYGETRSYSQQAAAIGRPTAARAVGAANGRNPVSIVLPCHRVVGANGSLTGFAGGLDAKRYLLAHEQSVRPLFPSQAGDILRS